MDLNCFSCRGPLCELCTGVNCIGCKGPKCTTCHGKDCSACSKPKCKTCTGNNCAPAGSTCDSLQCPIAGGDTPDPQEDEVQEQETGDICIPINLPGDPDPDSGSPANPNSPENPPGSGSGGGGPGSRPVPIQSPDTSQNKVTCYDSGQAASRANMVFAAQQFCLQYSGFRFKSHDSNALEVNFGWDEQHKAGLNILVFLEVQANCEWSLEQDECNKQLVQIIDGCDQDTTADKQGGVLLNNCIAWRIDPEFNKNISPPPPSSSLPSSPSSPPGSSQPNPQTGPGLLKPSVPDTKAKHRPKFDIFAYSQAIPSKSWVQQYGQQAVAYYEDYTTCSVAFGWTASAVVRDATMPDSINGITGVFSDTCRYQAQDVSYNAAAEGDVVGRLACNSYLPATCRKGKKVSTCGTRSYLLKVTCTWD